MCTKEIIRSDDPDDITMTPQELHILSELDSRQYGFLLLNSAANEKKRTLVKKAVKYLQVMVIQAHRQQRNQQTENDSSSKRISIDLRTWVKLGHFHLLLEEYDKALSAYQKYYRLNGDKKQWNNPTFLYGLGLVYYHYNAFQWAAKAFQQLLYIAPDFQRANETHLRLGLIFKITSETDLALKHLQLALFDNNPCSASKNMIKFHIAHLYEAQGRIKIAKERYETLLKDKNLEAPLRADIYRQLGWIYHSYDVLGDKNQRVASAIHCLQKAIENDPYSGQTLYLLGRCYASIGKVHDAFIAYRNSVEKSEGNADTWCSIGVLYQQQNQPMDALQAYICAVQLDKCHSAAWANLGILYETCNQARDALACYINSSRGMDESTNILLLSNKSINPNLTQRIAFLQSHLRNAPMPSLTNNRRHLLSIEEAWNLPISAEMSSRQQQQNKRPQGPPPPYPSPGNNNPAKRFKQEPGTATTPTTPPIPQTTPSFYLTPQQQQTLQYLQQQSATGTLNPTQAQHLAQLQHQQKLMQQHRAQQLQQQAQQQQIQQPPIQQPQVQTSTTQQFPQNSQDLSEEDLKDLLSQKDLAASLAENLLKHFGSEYENNNSFSTETNVKTEHDVLVVKTEPEAETGEAQKDNEKIVDMDSKSILEACRGEGTKGDLSKWEARGPPPRPPEPPSQRLGQQQLSPPVPSVFLDNKKYAFSTQLQEFCLKQPVAVVRGLSSALKLDLGLFSTKTLAETGPDQNVEVRTQLPEERGWNCASQRSHATVARYAHYQASTFKECLREERERASSTALTDLEVARRKGNNKNINNRNAQGSAPPKTVKTATLHVELSDERKWRVQLNELTKLPAFARVVSAGNMLSHVGHAIHAVNNVRLEMKVPGSRNPARQEHNNFCYVNINIGPGDCEWFAVPYEYWGAVHTLCEERQLSFLRGSWWPSADDLRAAAIPVYRFTQRPGDLVWVNAGCLHWTQAVGWCNNVSWNVGPLNAHQYRLSMERRDWNCLQGYKSAVPMLHLSWNLARNLKLSDSELFYLIKSTLMRTLRHYFVALEFARHRNVEVRYQGRTKNEGSHYCAHCEIEVFGVLFVREQEKRHIVHCIACARKQSPNLEGFVCLKEYPVEELMDVFDSFVLQPDMSNNATETAP